MPSMYEIYRRHRAESDRLVAAEDHERHLPTFLHSIVDWRGQTVLEGGLGTGRVTELYLEHARRVTGCDREAHMLAAAVVPVEVRVWPGQMHVFQLATPFVSESTRSLRQIGEYIREATW